MWPIRRPLRPQPVRPSRRSDPSMCGSMTPWPRCSRSSRTSRPPSSGEQPRSPISAPCTAPCRRCAAWFRATSGAVVQVGSALAYRAIPLQSAYCGAKFAIRGFTDSVRTELLHDKSRVWISMVQLPAVNTPQFGWCRSKLPDHPQPVPPIYQPEVPAEAVYWAAHHRRREVFCGGSTDRGDPGQQDCARQSWIDTSREPDTSRSRSPACPWSRTGRTTSSSRCLSLQRRMACSTTKPRRAVFSSGSRHIAASRSGPWWGQQRSRLESGRPLGHECRRVPAARPLRRADRSPRRRPSCRHRRGVWRPALV